MNSPVSLISARRRRLERDRDRKRKGASGDEII
jgi:hypothetical protein